MSHNILLGRFLPADGLLEGGSDAETGDLRVPSWTNDVAPCGRSPPRRPRRRRRKAFRDPLLQERRHQVLVQRSDSVDKERGGRHLLANHKLRGSELPATAAACNSAPEPDQQQARHTLRQGKGVLSCWPLQNRCRWSTEGQESTEKHDQLTSSTC